MKKQFIVCLLLIITLFINKNLFSQQTSAYNSPKIIYETGLELYQKEKYSSAYYQFEKVKELLKEQPNELYSNSIYYIGVSSYHLMSDNTILFLSEFINNYPQDSKYNSAKLYLAKYYFATKKYKKSLEHLKQLDPYDLTKSEQNEYNYKKGYCFFLDSNYTEAKRSFVEVKNNVSIYQNHALYYYSHICYNEKNYETARLGFESIKEDEYYSPIIPYYIIHIYYLQEKYLKIFELGPDLLTKSTEKRKVDINRIIGEAYYNTKQYSEAIPYFEQYILKSPIINREDYFQIANSYYKTSNWEKATSYFKEIIKEKDTLSQVSLYLLGDCAIKLNQKLQASNYFYESYKQNFVSNITEESLYNYSKLQNETSTNPFQNAIESFDLYLKKYPNTNRSDEIHNYLTIIFQTTKNYKAALNSLDKIKNKNLKQLITYQKMAHFRALEMFNNEYYDEAINLFRLSIKYDYSKEIAAANNYWLGETYYRIGNYDSTISILNQYLIMPGGLETTEYYNTNYTIGYAFFRQKEYQKALTSFRKFIDNSKKIADKKILSDAYNRTADCYFVNKNLNEAITNYNKVIEMKIYDVDYALYQKAMAQGASNKNDSKIETLTSLTKKYPRSNYSDDSYYEIAKTYNSKGNFSKAIEVYNKLIKEYPNSTFKKTAMLELGLVYNNIDNNQEALKILKEVVEKYPGTPESKDALINIKNIYVENSNVEDFFVYVKNIPFANVSNTEQDSITYLAAYNQYLLNDCEKAKKGFTNYIEKFPQGFFIANSQFYRAECMLSTGNINEALKGYEYILYNGKGSNFEENSLLRAASIEYNNKNYNKSIDYYQKLNLIANEKNNITIAIIGKMRSYYWLNNYPLAIKTAREIQTLDKVSETQIEESRLIIMRSAIELDSLETAKKECLILSTKSKTEAQAEAKYYLAYIDYKKQNLESSEKRIFELLSSNNSSEYWLAKSYILLGDIYIDKQNYFQAKHTYKSIIDNYEGEDLKIIATEKYNKALELEKNNPKSKK